MHVKTEYIQAVSHHGGTLDCPLSELPSGAPRYGMMLRDRQGKGEFTTAARYTLHPDSASM
jgi:hypothetical protein